MTDAEINDQLFPTRQLLLEGMLDKRQVELEIGILDGNELTAVTVGLDRIMELFAKEARIVAEETFGVSLDGTRKSLVLLDWIAGKQYEDEPKGLFARLSRKRMDDAFAQHFARMWSGYAGVVMHQYSSVTWGLGHDYRDERCMVALIAGEEVVPVVDLTIERLRTGRGSTFTDMFARIALLAPLSP
jgi:hypothetical protein